MKNISKAHLQIHAAKIEELRKIILQSPNSKWIIKKGYTKHTLRLHEPTQNTLLLDMCHLNELLYINEDESYICVESCMRMDDLVEELLPYGYRPKVIPEFKGITVGGAIQGLAGESSSHKYGLFHESSLAYEVLTGNGEIITASPDMHADLFYALPGSYGTIGLITMVKLAVVRCKPYVNLRYTTKTITDFINSTTDCDYLDGIITGPDQVIAIEAEETAHRDKNKYFYKGNRWFSEWYYEHVKQRFSTINHFSETMTLYDYLFRYDRGCFWIASYKLKHTLWNRLIYGYHLSSDRMYKRTLSRTHPNEREAKQIVQDIMIPKSAMGDTMAFIEKNVPILPLWLLPMKVTQTHNYLFSLPYINEDYFNVGIYGKPSRDNPKSIKRSLGLHLATCGARMVLHSECYYTREEFWDIYPQKAYDDIRKKYYGDIRYPDIYDKVAGFFNSHIGVHQTK